MEVPQQQQPMPKKSCMITIMFGIEDDKKALDIKEVIDNAVKDIDPKRYTFQISET
ncbi:unnamed protein product [marine sediment metagenome]|uniref:Uncharacterized protein n=1 Tax=marine sediment metagenome TaxID=412755 RepID=X1U5C7_9ZZZZ